MQRLRILSNLRSLAGLLALSILSACATPQAETPAASPPQAQKAQPTAVKSPAQPATATPAPAGAGGPAKAAERVQPPPTKPADTQEARPAKAQTDGKAAEPTKDAKKDAKPQKLKVGQLLPIGQDMQQVFPKPGKVDLTNRNGRPLALVFWSTGSKTARDELQFLDRFLKEKRLLTKMDFYAVGAFRPGRQKAADLADMAHMMGLETLPVIGDPDVELAKLIGVQQYPEIVLINPDGKLAAKGIRGLDHGRLNKTTCRELLLQMASEGSIPPIPRSSRFYPANRLRGNAAPDFELPLFSGEGWGKGGRARFSEVVSGDRPIALFFFSSTCKHCQIDVPQIAEFRKTHADAYDIIGITRIKHDRHRQISDQYFKAQGLDFPIFEDVGPVSEAYNVTSTPTTFYMAPDMTVGHVTYYQHKDLEKDYMTLHPKLMKLKGKARSSKAEGWNFPLKVKAEDGADLDFETLKGKNTLVHFWATWCAPCREELPKLLATLPQLEEAGNVLLVTVENNGEVLGRYRKSSGLDFKSYHSPSGGLADKIDFSRSVPRTYLLDENGNVTKVLAGSYKWDDAQRLSLVAGRLAGY